MTKKHRVLLATILSLLTVAGFAQVQTGDDPWSDPETEEAFEALLDCITPSSLYSADTPLFAPFATPERDRAKAHRLIDEADDELIFLYAMALQRVAEETAWLAEYAGNRLARPGRQHPAERSGVASVKGTCTRLELPPTGGHDDSVIDTLQAARAFRKASFREAQAEAVLQMMKLAVEGDLVTKADFRVESEVVRTEFRCCPHGDQVPARGHLPAVVDHGGRHRRDDGGSDQAASLSQLAGDRIERFDAPPLAGRSSGPDLSPCRRRFLVPVTRDSPSLPCRDRSPGSDHSSTAPGGGRYGGHGDGRPRLR